MCHSSQESWSLKKKISDIEEQLKVIKSHPNNVNRVVIGCFLIEPFLQAKEELMLENQRLKDENGALIRVITKLSK